MRKEIGVQCVSVQRAAVGMTLNFTLFIVTGFYSLGLLFFYPPFLSSEFRIPDSFFSVLSTPARTRIDIFANYHEPLQSKDP
jgi:hypothetical protein